MTTASSDSGWRGGHFGTEDYEYFLSIQLTRVAKGSKTKEVNLIVGEG